MEALQLGQTVTVYSAASTTGTTSGVYAMPARLCNLTWQYFFTTNPSAITWNVQASNDGVNFATVDSTTITTGQVRTITGLAANFIRINQGAITGGGGQSVLLVARAQ
jgi:hypothetical protein